MLSAYMGFIFLLNILLVECLVRRIEKQKEGRGDKVTLYKWLLIVTAVFAIAWGSGDTILIPSLILYIVIGQVLVIGYRRSF